MDGGDVVIRFLFPLLLFPALGGWVGYHTSRPFLTIATAFPVALTLRVWWWGAPPNYEIAVGLALIFMLMGTFSGYMSARHRGEEHE